MDREVASRDVELPEDVPSEAREGVFGAADVVAPSASSDRLTVVDPGALDALIADTADLSVAQGDSIVVGAAEVPLKDLVGAIYGEDAERSMSEGRPDLLASGHPWATLSGLR
jgi:hypothetical protein